MHSAVGSSIKTKSTLCISSVLVLVPCWTSRTSCQPPGKLPQTPVRNTGIKTIAPCDRTENRVLVAPLGSHSAGNAFYITDTTQRCVMRCIFRHGHRNKTAQSRERLFSCEERITHKSEPSSTFKGRSRVSRCGNNREASRRSPHFGQGTSNARVSCCRFQDRVDQLTDWTQTARTTRVIHPRNWLRLLPAI